MTIGYDYIILVRTVSRSICVVFVRSALEVSAAGTRAPSLAHERLLRRARRTLQELGFFVQAQLLKPDSDSTRQVKQVQRAANIVLDQQRCAPLLSSPLLFFFSPLVLSLWALTLGSRCSAGHCFGPSAIAYTARLRLRAVAEREAEAEAEEIRDKRSARLARFTASPRLLFLFLLFDFLSEGNIVYSFATLQYTTLLYSVQQILEVRFNAALR